MLNHDGSSQRPWELSGTSVAVEADNTHAALTRAPGPGSESYGSVYWRWVAPSNLVVTLDTFGSAFHTYLGVFQFTTNGVLMTVASSQDSPLSAVWSHLQFAATEGVEYRIAVASLDYQFAAQADWGAISLHLTSRPARPILEAPVPRNDQRTNALELIPGTAVSGTSRGATGEGFFGARFGITNVVWYRWTPPEAGYCRIRVTGTSVQPRFFLQSIGVNYPINLATNELVWETEMPVTAGQIHQIGVGTIDPAGDDFQIRLDFSQASPWAGPPANDHLENAIEIIDDVGCWMVNLKDSRPEASTSFEGNNGDRRSGDVWWRWKAKRRQEVDIRGLAFSINPYPVIPIAVFLRTADGKAGRNLLYQSPHKLPQVYSINFRFTAEPGQEYLILAGNTDVGPTGRGLIYFNAALNPATPWTEISADPLTGGARLQIHSTRARQLQAQRALARFPLRWEPFQDPFGPTTQATIPLPAQESGTPSFYRAVLVP